MLSKVSRAQFLKKPISSEFMGTLLERLRGSKGEEEGRKRKRKKKMITHPRQFLVPLAKAIRYLSSLGFSIQRSGRNLRGLAKASGFMSMITVVMFMDVPAESHTVSHPSCSCI